MSSSSSQYNLVLCLFLLSFSSLINSQTIDDYFVVRMTNETPSTANAGCYVNGEDIGSFAMESGETYEYNGNILRGVNNTLSCEMKLDEKHGFFNLFDLNDTKICHSASEVCNWSIHEDGLCMLVSHKCVLFKWDTSTTHHSFRNVKVNL
ncbi:hypothetical protein P3S67_002304 [Capsicum chacoense]